jgi:hypothetical protein
MQPIGQTMVGGHRSQPTRSEAMRLRPPHADAAGPEPQRSELQRQAEGHARAAEAAALTGDIETAAREILRGLDCERRAGSVGPQVLQLIKPRA